MTTPHQSQIHYTGHLFLHTIALTVFAAIVLVLTWKKIVRLVPDAMKFPLKVFRKDQVAIRLLDDAEEIEDTFRDNSEYHDEEIMVRR
ncbi:hypothetical protein NEOLI_003881 [Neolecta irregularis DAH-3]|uniref:Uncharacterized protein n=1 Tax=Neolecta irregularis (strain DAH-3) TaxID=1198029 RepID=A0A1U7LP89_NEOID|nr:hypothetical protein NEOLI_003881 [Neolecta irregularis DAH-3]|eukprot:OLL24467.1 hypothetical protein NEOLI_003881 [Neolecta irregularis DAH-3]